LSEAAATGAFATGPAMLPGPPDLVIVAAFVVSGVLMGRLVGRDVFSVFSAGKWVRSLRSESLPSGVAFAEHVAQPEPWSAYLCDTAF